MKTPKSGLIFATSQIFVVAIRGGKNRKTGRVVSIWILDRTMDPAASRRNGRDARVQCKGCPLSSFQGCYVEPRALAGIWKKFMRGGYLPLEIGSPEWNKFFGNQFVRFGAYGNPSKLPLAMVQNIANLARGWTGYFHDWHLMPADRAQQYGRFFMASTHAGTVDKAKSLNLRTFTTGAGNIKTEGSIECLADAKGLTCAQCGLCDGTNRRDGKLPHVWIAPHGYQTKRAQQALN